MLVQACGLHTAAERAPALSEDLVQARTLNRTWLETDLVISPALQRAI